MYEFNPEETKKIQSKPVFAIYRKWLEKNRVIIHPSIIYPAYFGEKGRGVIGVASAKPIPKSQALLAIPYDLMITVDTVKNNEELAKIIKDNPNMFKLSNEAASKIIILFVCYELMKKGESFYAPYFDIATQIFLSNWTHIEMVGVENPQIARELKEEKEAMEGYFMKFLRIFKRYPDIFPQEMPTIEYKSIYDIAHTFVCTRAFGWSLPSVSLIPMADSLNHHNNYLIHYLVDLQQELKPHPSYIQRHKKVDLSILGEPKLKLAEKQLNLLKKPKKTRSEKFVLKHKEILKGEKLKSEHLHILHQQYKAEVRNLRQLHFYDSSCSQDNDTDEETFEDFAFREEQFKFYEKYERRHIDEKNKFSELRNYWKLYLDPDLIEEETEKDQMQINKEETKKAFEDEGNQSRCSSEVSSTDSSDDDQSFEWMLSSTSHKGRFFVLSTNQEVEAEEQIYNFYGRRSNKFLLLNYNFVLQENKYDSFEFMLNINWELDKMPINKLIFGKGTDHTKEIRLKSQRINTDLINHCRALLIGWNKINEFKNIRITIPFNLDFEKKVLALAADIVKHLMQNYMTSIQEDEQLLQSSVKHENTTSLIMKISHKKILKQQLKLISRCQQMLKQWKGRRLDVKENQMVTLKRVRAYFCQLERAKI